MKMKSGATGMFWKSFYRALMRVLGFFFFFFFRVLSQSFWFSSQIFEFQVGISKFWVNVSEFLDDISKFRAKFSNIESKFQNSKSKFCYSESITYFKIPSRMFTFIRVKISKFRI